MAPACLVLANFGWMLFSLFLFWGLTKIGLLGLIFVFVGASYPRMSELKLVEGRCLLVHTS